MDPKIIRACKQRIDTTAEGEEASSPTSMIEGINIEDIKSSLKQNAISSAAATYSDGVMNIEEHKKNAGLIVAGTAISQEFPSNATVATKVKVTKTMKGKKLDEIIIYQLGTKVMRRYLRLVRNIIYF
ncbi:hypothetical protein PCURB6_43410 [Paenibacillus curdlanolyticus]|nr:hypothetical protein PCURB6_43410 [Paenibacillus curdlanolyticus]